MTVTTSRNEERTPPHDIWEALAYVREEAGDWRFDSRYRDGLATALTYIEKMVPLALAAERRATVERIRTRCDTELGVTVLVAKLLAILDEEAAR